MKKLDTISISGVVNCFCAILICITTNIRPQTFETLSEFQNKLNNNTINLDYREVIIHGLNMGGEFGHSVAKAGDVNGDGYDDILIGAPGYNSNKGIAYIYFGGAVLDTVIDVVLSYTYLIADDRFGVSVSSAGDINGDGYSDVIIGANGRGSGRGEVYIYYGGTAMDGIEDIRISGISQNDRFGESVSTAGDVNGDGYADVIVGAPRYNTYTGRVFIYYGSNQMNITPDVAFYGEGQANSFGKSVATVGDINNDGYADVVIGASGYSSGSGKAYLYYGNSNMDNIADIIFNAQTNGESLGRLVSKIGDVNGDGYYDIYVGAYNKSYLYFGGILVNNIPDVTFIGNNNFGNAASLVGDINEDGYTDIIIGAFEYNNSAGIVYLYNGGLTIDSLYDTTFVGQLSNEKYGYAISDIGDILKSGRSAFIIAAPGFNLNTGRVYLYYNDSPISVESENYSHNSFILSQNYPNPFNPSTIINYQIPVSGIVTINVYDVLGKEVAILVNEEKPSGSYEVEFDATHLVSGIYFYKLQAGDFIQTKKMILLK